MRQEGLFGLSDHLKRLSAHGDPLEELSRIVDFDRQLKDRATSPWAGRSSMRRWWPRPSSATPNRRSPRSRSKTAAEIWPDEPARAAQKDTDAR